MESFICQQRHPVVSALAFLSFIGLLFISSQSQAGATASSWVVVVNGNSQNSRTIANHYVQLRDIPARNVIVVADIPNSETIDSKQFETSILKPLLAEIESRGLSGHIQGIAYSCDIPTRINYPPVPADSSPYAQYLTPTASINSATYLYQLTLSENATPIQLVNNYYCRFPVSQMLQLPIPKLLLEEYLAARSAADPEAEEVKLESFNFANDAEFLKFYVKKYPFQHAAWFRLAVLAANQDDRESTFSYLEDAIKAGWQYGQMLNEEPAFAKFALDPRFQGLSIAAGNAPTDWTEPRGFDARAAYTPNGITVKDPNAGLRYMLSMVLASTGPLGNSMEEAIAALKLAKSADHTSPDGTFYFSLTADVRTTCRAALFPTAIDKLHSIGFGARQINAVMPAGRRDCLGVTMGTPDFNWALSRSELIPGAIGDNLTSVGGDMEHAGQTKITAYLKHGAAGAAGAVAEPFSLQQKFPLPLIHETYARGSTLAEAFYQNLMGPYQMLILGDPLCQPWATPPKYEVSGLQSDKTIESFVTAEIKDVDDDSALFTQPPNSYLVLINALPRAAATGKVRMTIDPAKSKLRGAYNLRVVAERADANRTRDESSYWVQFGSPEQQLELKIETISKPAFHTEFIANLNSPASTDVAIRHNWETIATVKAGEKSVKLDRQQLGDGPVRLQAVTTNDNLELASLPVWINVD